jgi:hypothetical protein
LLHAFIATHFLTMVVFAPYDYENRLVLPMYLFVTVFSAAGLARIAAPLATRLGLNIIERHGLLGQRRGAVDPA